VQKDVREQSLLRRSRYHSNTMPVANIIVSVFCSALGMAVSFLLVVLLHRQTDRQAGTRLGMTLGVAVFLIYSNIGYAALVREFSSPLRTLPDSFSTAFPSYIGSFLPALILWSWRASPVLRWKTRISRPLLAFAFVSGTLICAALFLPWITTLNHLPPVYILSANGFICLVPAIVSILKQPLDKRFRSFLRVNLSLYLCGLSIGLFTPAQISTQSILPLLISLLHLTCVLASFLGSFILAARFRYLDVFVRWSTRITILGFFAIISALSFTAIAGLGRPLARTLGALACTGEVFALLLLGIELTRRCEHWVETHVLQLTDLKTEAVVLHNSIFTATDKTTLLDLLASELTRCLEASEVKVLPIPRGGPPDLERGLPGYFNSETSAHRDARDGDLASDVEVLVPINTNGGTEFVISVSIGPGRRSLHNGEIRFLGDLAQQTAIRLQQLESEAARQTHLLREAILKEQLTAAELSALRAKINPHFLFNSLNTIADLIVRNPVNAERMTLRLSSVFRHVLVQADSQFVSLGKEFDFLKDYLAIEKERFGNDLCISLELDASVTHFMVPTLLLQPIVENAIKHGLTPKGGIRTLRVSANRRGRKVVIEVEDNGVGFENGLSVISTPRTHRVGSGVGLANTRARLKAVYDEEATFAIESMPMRGSCIRISLPVQEVLA
jgi:two-component system LytT family sensor kinase